VYTARHVNGLKASMSSRHSNQCRLCQPVSLICYWGPRPERKWKRWGLFVCSVLIAGFAVFMFMPRYPDAITLYGLSGLLFLMGIGGAVVALLGCDACVARLSGDAL
jgi:hypothetical protein